MTKALFATESTATLSMAETIKTLAIKAEFLGDGMQVQIPLEATLYFQCDTTYPRKYSSKMNNWQCDIEEIQTFLRLLHLITYYLV